MHLLFTLAVSAAVVSALVAKPFQRQDGNHFVSHHKDDFDSKWTKVDYDQPVFWGLKPQHYFYQESGQDWSTGIAAMPKSMNPFTKDWAGKLIHKLKSLVTNDYRGTALQLLLTSLVDDLAKVKGLNGFYAIKKGDTLQIGSTGYWWAGVFRNGKLVHSNEKAKNDLEASWNGKKKSMSVFWTVQNNDMLIITRGEFGVRNQFNIRWAIQQAEKKSAKLHEVASGLVEKLMKDKTKGVDNVFAAIRMVKSSHQLLEL